MTNFSDIFKKGFLEMTNGLTLESFSMSMLAAFLCGMVIYFVYRGFYKGVVYNNNFNILLVMTTMITCFIVIVISSNVVLSLGMVGALSIVRFRTAVKDPLDVGFLFWTVAVGITCGAGLYIISLFATASIALIYILLIQVRNRKHVYLLIVKYHADAAEQVMRTLAPIRKVLKNRTTIQDATEVTYEIRFAENQTAFVGKLAEIEGVEHASVVEFTGDYCE